jgi:hypothetical protein
MMSVIAAHALTHRGLRVLASASLGQERKRVAEVTCWDVNRNTQLAVRVVRRNPAQDARGNGRTGARAQRSGVLTTTSTPFFPSPLSTFKQ